METLTTPGAIKLTYRVCGGGAAIDTRWRNIIQNAFDASCLRKKQRSLPTSDKAHSRSYEKSDFDDQLETLCVKLPQPGLLYLNGDELVHILMAFTQCPFSLLFSNDLLDTWWTSTNAQIPVEMVTSLCFAAAELKLKSPIFLMGLSRTLKEVARFFRKLWTVTVIIRNYMWVYPARGMCSGR